MRHSQSPYTESVSESVGWMVTHESVLKHLVFKRVILRSKCMKIL